MNGDVYFQLPPHIITMVKQLHGPILIFGGGGFIGINLFKSLFLYRNDVFMTSHTGKKNWRIHMTRIPSSSVFDADITNQSQTEKIIRALQPNTIFNVTAYGGYSKQKQVKKIFSTNIDGTMHILRAISYPSFAAYVQTGSSSEYGENAAGPQENGELFPNSYYAVSKTACYYLLKYFGKVLGMPVIHMRLYAVYGPFEEPDRLIPVLLTQGRKGLYPPFVHPEISRDFIYVRDVTTALITAAGKMEKKLYGEVFNVGTGKKTTISQLADIAKKIFSLPGKPQFQTMENRQWDHVQDWYANIEKIQSVLGWKPEVTLVKGLQYTVQWQKSFEKFHVIANQSELVKQSH